MHMGKSSSEQSAGRPYQGVRVKDPVKELLRRKRGHNASNIKTAPPTAVVVPNNSFPSYSHVGAPMSVESTHNVPNDSTVDLGALCTGWIAQPASAPLQSTGQWSSPDCLHHDQPVTTFTSDMYVQTVCPSYTVVGPPSMLTLPHAPLFTNFGTLGPTPSALPQVDLPDTSLTYIPWAPPLTTLSSPVMQCSPCPPALSGTQLLPVPVTLPLPLAESNPEQAESADQAQEDTLALEKLLEDHEEQEDQKDSYICGPSLFSQDM
ncbi:POU domain class 2-associating factor 1 [Chanos chanos]|uniref:POU domain class 2-associating factor 1 n=1 Tax=Chanos chanos TaxID=29144 RepID=A0A6J2VNS8_CHACN|nr:POU domain class 2-associating factor 1 [Chanos chanos]